MRIALAQLNPIVGDVAGNTALVLDAIEKARGENADVVVTSELALIGYPPRDLLLRDGVVEACEKAIHEIAQAAGDLYVIVGYPRRTQKGLRGMRNSAAICHRGEIIAVADKQLLPGYDVFDEDRYFDPGETSCIVEMAGMRVAVLICEDLWHADDVKALARYSREPTREIPAARGGCDALISLNASPFVQGKFRRHVEQLRDHSLRLRAPIISVNQVGANDDLVFDGRSLVADERGEVVCILPGFESALRVVDLALPLQAIAVPDAQQREVFDALLLGVKDYFRKTGASRAVIGLSGGIDSALTAVIAAAALGTERVTGVLMPSQYSSRGSIDDAKALCAGVGMDDPLVFPIHLAHDVIKGALAEALGDITGSLADENTQARIRGILLMAVSNATTGSLVLSTSNKSEIATGYSTLYGDMCGALAPLGDVLKTRVYELARWVNDNFNQIGFSTPPIPESSIDKVPSAELRPNQTDQDTLPPYETLDAIVERFIEREEAPERIVAETGVDESLVQRFIQMIDRAQYKREQAAVIPKVTPRAFGRGRSMPIVMKVSCRSELSDSRSVVGTASESIKPQRAR